MNLLIMRSMNLHQMLINVPQELKWQLKLLVAKFYFFQMETPITRFWFELFGVKRLEVYNRYGKLYSRNNYKKEWFGQDSGNGALPTGTYFYIITFNDNSKPKSGSVYINR